jgi:hypothetical protein
MMVFTAYLDEPAAVRVGRRWEEEIWAIVAQRGMTATKTKNLTLITLI